MSGNDERVRELRELVRDLNDVLGWLEQRNVARAEDVLNEMRSNASTALAAAHGPGRLGNYEPASGRDLIGAGRYAAPATPSGPQPIPARMCTCDPQTGRRDPGCVHCIPATPSGAAASQPHYQKWMIIFDDPDHAPLFFEGLDAERAARGTHKKLCNNWTCELFLSAADLPLAARTGEAQSLGSREVGNVIDMWEQLPNDRLDDEDFQPLLEAIGQLYKALGGSSK